MLLLQFIIIIFHFYFLVFVLEKPIWSVEFIQLFPLDRLQTNEDSVSEEGANERASKLIVSVRIDLSAVWTLILSRLDTGYKQNLSGISNGCLETMFYPKSSCLMFCLVAPQRVIISRNR